MTDYLNIDSSSFFIDIGIWKMIRNYFITYKFIFFMLLIVASPVFSNAQTAIQTQLGSNIKYIVAKDGSGQYSTVQAAINAIPNNSASSQVIFIKKGTYTEKVEIPSTKTNLVLIGEDASKTIIAYNDYSGSGKKYNGIISSAVGVAIGTSTSHTLYIAANDFTMMNITISNTAGDVGQAVAVNSNGDRHIFYHCRLIGYQDTYYTWSQGRFLLKDCFIEGATDYIFGRGAALFENCHINSLKTGSFITAASTDQNFKYGYVFSNCKLTANTGISNVFLGRPWGAYAKTVFMNTEEGSAINTAGWSIWSSNTNHTTCSYAEFSNCGAGSGTTKRASWSKQLTSAQAALYTRATIFDKSVKPSPYSSSWLPSPESNALCIIIKNNTQPFINSTCVPTTTTCTASIYSSTTNLCTSPSIVLSTGTGKFYKWFRNNNQVGTASTYTATEAGAYTVEITNGAGCKAISVERILTGTLQTTPTISAPTTTICFGSAVKLTTTTGDSYKWFNGATQVGNSSTFDVTETGDYTVEVTNGGGCKASSEKKTITVHALPIITQNAKINTGAWLATSTATVCPTGTLTLGPWPTQTGTWTWTGPNNFNSTLRDPILTNLVAANAGTYTTTYTDATGCKATSTFKLNIAALPTATVSSSTTNLCSTGSIVLSTGSGDSYIWFKDNKQVGTDATFTATEAGAYTVEITNAADCKATSAARILTLTPQAIPVITAPTTSICVGNSVVLSTNTGAAYKWFKGTTQVGTAATLPVTEAGAYTVEVTNNSGCKALSTVKQINLTSATKWYADTDNDGKGDATTTLLSCTQPQGYVTVAGDACPTDANKTATGNCGCGNTEASCLDCAGIPNGTAVFDNCNICVGGTTGNTACITTATTNGTHANITVIPQPFDVNTSISIEHLGMIQLITIVNAAGSIVETKQHINTKSITLGESLSSGLYTVIIQSEKGVYTTKIVKK